FLSQSQTQPQSASGSAPVVPLVGSDPYTGVDDISLWLDARDLRPDFIT
ncbi:hypothetical protein LINPERPRIM_LOCUS6598, partial [Linum perenne]